MYEFTFIILFFLFFVSYQGNHKKETINNLLLLAILLLIFQDGLRWRVGTDWKSYEEFFISCNDSNVRENGFDPAYVFVNKLIRIVFDDYAFFVLFHALFIYTVFYWFIKKYSPIPLLSVFVLYFSMLTYLGMNRQYIALCLCIIAIPTILKKKLKIFFLLIFVAFLFHLSAVIFVIAYFVNKEWKTNTYCALLGLSILFALSGIIHLIPSDIFYLLSFRMGEKADLLFQQEVNVSTINVLLGIIKRCIWIIPLLIMRKEFRQAPSFWLFYNLFFISTLLYILFNGTLFQFVVQRGLIYFNIFEIIIIPYLFSSLKNRLHRLFFVLLISLLGFYQLERTFLVYKKAIGNDIYRPYNAIYMDRYKVYDDGR